VGANGHSNDTSAAREARGVARRQLLRSAIYAVPALLGTFALARRAEAQVSCAPSCSCSPGMSLCGPDCCLPNINCAPWFCGPVQNCGPSPRN
jgi:hypothetical protein